MNVSSHQTEPLAVTLNVELVVTWAVPDASLARVTRERPGRPNPADTAGGAGVQLDRQRAAQRRATRRGDRRRVVRQPVLEGRRRGRVGDREALVDAAVTGAERVVRVAGPGGLEAVATGCERVGRGVDRARGRGRDALGRGGAQGVVADRGCRGAAGRGRGDRAAVAEEDVRRGAGERRHGRPGARDQDRVADGRARRDRRRGRRRDRARAAVLDGPRTKSFRVAVTDCEERVSARKLAKHSFWRPRKLRFRPPS